ncbi:MAG: c(7)-type cytochrome triheme domain-containing protein [Thermodesulfobacteriota bacterium]
MKSLNKKMRKSINIVRLLKKADLPVCCGNVLRLLFVVAFLFLTTTLITYKVAYAEFEGDLEWGDLILEKSYESMKKAKVDKVVFPHWFHRIRFRCKSCHEVIFTMKKGSNDINMSGIIKGKWCGKCHNGKIAFAPVKCPRCHSYNEETIKQKANLVKLKKSIKDNDELFLTAAKEVKKSRNANAEYLLEIAEQLRDLSKQQMVKKEYKMALESYNTSTHFAISAIRLSNLTD